MDIYEYLKLDHEHVAKLFKQFENAESLTRKKQIIALISQELTVHADAEQATFYMMLENFEDTKNDAIHGEDEHEEIKQNIAVVLFAKKWGPSWHQNVIKLKEIVEHHVKEEEGTLFKKAKKILTEEDAWELKEKMHYLKQHLFLELSPKNEPDHA